MSGFPTDLLSNSRTIYSNLFAHWTVIVKIDSYISSSREWTLLHIELSQKFPFPGPFCTLESTHFEMTSTQFAWLLQVDDRRRNLYNLYCMDLFGICIDLVPIEAYMLYTRYHLSGYLSGYHLPGCDPNLFLLMTAAALPSSCGAVRSTHTWVLSRVDVMILRRLDMWLGTSWR